jgi:hypothetical protein
MVQLKGLRSQWCSCDHWGVAAPQPENYQEEHRRDSAEDNHFRQTSCKEMESYHWSLAKQQSTGQLKISKEAVVSLTLTPANC